VSLQQYNLALKALQQASRYKDWKTYTGRKNHIAFVISTLDWVELVNLAYSDIDLIATTRAYVEWIAVKLVDVQIKEYTIERYDYSTEGDYTTFRFGCTDVKAAIQLSKFLKLRELPDVRIFAFDLPRLTTVTCCSIANYNKIFYQAFSVNYFVAGDNLSELAATKHAAYMEQVNQQPEMFEFLLDRLNN